MLKRLCPRSIIVCLGTVALFIAGSASAAESGNGSKNFRTPTSVPNYFSNESGPMLGPAYETQRGALYMGQTYGSLQPSARAAAVEAPRQVAAVPVVPRVRERVAVAQPRGRTIRGRSARVASHQVAARGRVVTRVAAHGSGRAHVAYATSRTSRAGGSAHTVGRTTRVSSTHRRARG
ncbi:MAG: hypothetical protein JO096_02255 [Alphaproteobacteria bacterium]|nr:hypothetical protein [Alphaproteobacteria bacterium]